MPMNACIGCQGRHGTGCHGQLNTLAWSILKSRNEDEITHPLLHTLDRLMPPARAAGRSSQYNQVRSTFIIIIGFWQ
jgi:hypothetical protein